ncbi:hypothetical protein D3C80_1288480 [compost metagenome]
MNVDKYPDREKLFPRDFLLNQASQKSINTNAQAPLYLIEGVTQLIITGVTHVSKDETASSTAAIAIVSPV